MKCYYCNKNIKQASGTARTFIETDPDPNAPHQDRFRCLESPSMMHFPEAYKIVEARTVR